LDKKDALLILQINEEATKKQIEKRYEIILRQARFDKTIDTTIICEAYDCLTKNYNYEDKSIMKQKIENFWYYNSKLILFITGMLIFSVLGMVFISLYIKAHPKPDLTLFFVGDKLITSEEIKLIKEYCKDTLGFEAVDVQTYILVKEWAIKPGEITIEKLSRIVKSTSVGFVVANGNSILELLKEGVLADLTLHWNNLGIKKDDERIYKLYSHNGNEVPYTIKPYGTDIFGVDNLLEKFPYVAIFRKSIFDNKTCDAIKKILN